MADQEMSVFEHLAELRRRLLIIFLAVLSLTILSYFQIPALIEFLTGPIRRYHLKLVYFSLTEGFTTRFKLAAFTSTILLSPLIFYQILAFIHPGLTGKERRVIYRSLFWLSLFFGTGVATGYLLFLPPLLKLLISYGKQYMVPVFSGNTYFSFVVMMGLVTGVTSIIPLLIIALGKLGLISFRALKKGRKFVIIGGLFLAGLISPVTDLVTFLFLLLPCLILYEVSVWTVFFIERRRAKKGNEKGGISHVFGGTR